MAEPAPDHVRSVTSEEYERLTAAWLARARGGARPGPVGPVPQPAPVPGPRPEPAAPWPWKYHAEVARLSREQIEARPAPHPAPPDPGPPPDLKEGDEVEVRQRTGRGSREGWLKAVVAAKPLLHHGQLGWLVPVRRLDPLPSGRSRHLRLCQASRVRLVRKYDPVAGNIYADYLEEQGFAEAADALRAAFPLAGGEGPG